MLFPTHNLWTLAAAMPYATPHTTLTAYGIRGTLRVSTRLIGSAALLSADFVRITLLAFLGVRCWSSCTATAVADSMVLLPVGWDLWAAGFVALYGFKLNFMTICVLPMLLGTTSDYGIYIVHRFIFRGRSDMQDAMQVTGWGSS